MTSARQRMRDERGAVLVAGLLLTLAVLIVIGAAVDIGRAFIERRELVSLADGAALSGSQTLDLEALHAGRLALDPSEAQATALAVLATEPQLRAQATASPASVSVEVERKMPTVLLRLAGLSTLTVKAQATAELGTGVVPLDQRGQVGPIGPTGGVAERLIRWRDDVVDPRPRPPMTDLLTEGALIDPHVA